MAFQIGANHICTVFFRQDAGRFSQSTTNIQDTFTLKTQALEHDVDITLTTGAMNPSPQTRFMTAISESSYSSTCSILLSCSTRTLGGRIADSNG